MLHHFIEMDQGHQVNSSPLAFKDGDGPVDVHPLDLSELIPLVHPLHALQPLLLFHYFGSMLRVEQASVHNILVDLSANAVHLAVLARYISITSQVVQWFDLVLG